MPLGVPNPNPPAPSSNKKSPSSSRPSGYFSLMEQMTGGTPLGSGPQRGPVAPGTLTPRGTPYSSFQVTPEYSNVGAWQGWDKAIDQSMYDAAGYARGVMGESLNFLTGGGVDMRPTMQQYYTDQYGADAVDLAMKSGMDPAVFFSLGDKARQNAAAWGTNLSNSRDIIAQQQDTYDLNLNAQEQSNAFIDEWGALQDLRQTNLQNQFNQGTGMAQARYDVGMDQLQRGLDIDLGLLGERRYRDVDLGRQNNAADLLHNSNMAGVLDRRRGLIGDAFSQQQGYLNEQLGFIGDRQDLAYDRFQTNDAYKAGQAQDLMAQYGFAGREYDTQIQEAFANRETQKRANTSSAAAAGAFGSAGFRDNVQDIYGGYDRQKDRAGLQLDRTTQSLDERDREIGNQRDNLRFGYDDQVIGFNSDIARVNDAHARNKIQTEGAYNDLSGQMSANQRDRTKLLNVDKGLSSMAREYGLRENDLRNQFEGAVTKLGLDLNETNQRLEQMLNSGNADLMAQGMNFMRQMMAYQ